MVEGVCCWSTRTDDETERRERGSGGAGGGSGPLCHGEVMKMKLESQPLETRRIARARGSERVNGCDGEYDEKEVAQGAL